MLALRQESNEFDRRGRTRTAIDHPSTVRVQGCGPLEIEVNDLSSTGLSFTLAQSIGIGQPIQIGLAGAGVAEAVVIRCEGRLHGAEFVRPLLAGQLDAAFSNGVVIRDVFPVSMLSMPPLDRKWPRPVRAATWILGAVGSWALVLGLFVL